MIFKDAWVLLFSPLIIIIIYLVKRRDNFSSIKFSSVDLVTPPRPTLRLFLAKNIILFRAAALSLFLLALARPQIPLDETKISAEGIDILLAIDSSGSMLAEDFEFSGKRRNRLEVVKRVVEDFIRQRKNDRIGMIAFAARAYTVCPLTLDYDWLIRNLERVEIGAIEDGTAVGSAITSSLNRLKDSEAKSKIVILLTDGINNMGSISPAMAAEAAQALGIKIYTIGAGTKGLAPYPIKGPWGETIYKDINIEIDEDMLREIAGKTGGEYFRATDTESLKEIYDQINKMEKTPVEELGFQEFEELFSKFLKVALLILALEIFLTNTLLRKLP